MTNRLPHLAAVLLLGIAAPLAATPAFAQDSQQQAVRDALGRAQTGAGQRAVEDLINRLRGAPAQAAPNPGPAGSTAAPAPASAPAGTPPATTVSAPGSIPPAPPAAAATPTAVPVPPATAAPAVAGPASPAGSAGSAPAVTPTAAPATAATAPRPGTPAAATAARPVVTPTARQNGSPAATPTAATAGAPAVVTIPRGGDIMAKAPEIAEKMNVPRADIEVFFDFNSAAISPKAKETLETMGQALSDPRLKDQRFIIGGHTDGKGRADFNLNLSRRRAEAVRKFVIDQYKIEPTRLVARGYGKSRLKNSGMPLADENRRVQIINLTRMEAAMRNR